MSTLGGSRPTLIVTNPYAFLSKVLMSKLRLMIKAPVFVSQFFHRQSMVLTYKTIICVTQILLDTASGFITMKRFVVDRTNSLISRIKEIFLMMGQDILLTTVMLFQCIDITALPALVYSSLQLFGIRITRDPTYSVATSLFSFITQTLNRLDDSPRLITMSGVSGKEESFPQRIAAMWNDITSLLHDFKFKYVFKIIALMIISPLLSLTPFDFCGESFEVFYESFSKLLDNHKDLSFLTWAVELVAHFSSSVINYFAKGEFSSDFKALDVYNVWTEDAQWLIDNEHNTTLSSDDADARLIERNFARLLEETIARGTDLLREEPKFKKSFARASMNSDLASLKAIRKKRCAISAMYENSFEPFSVLIYGIPGCGKSLIADLLFAYYRSLFRYEGGREGVFNVSTQSEFWDGLKNSHWGLFMDDIAKEHPNLQNPGLLSMVIDIINGVGTIANMAHLDDKGNIVLNFDMVVGTTNVEDLNARRYYSVPMAIHRRFPYIIEVDLKPEFRLPDGRIDKDAVRRYKIDNHVPLHRHIDCHIFIIKKPGLVNSIFTPTIIRRIDTYEEFFDFMVPLMKAHRAEQEASSKARAEVYASDLCRICGHLTYLCRCKDSVLVPSSSILKPKTASSKRTFFTTLAVGGVASLAYFYGIPYITSRVKSVFVQHLGTYLSLDTLRSLARKQLTLARDVLLDNYYGLRIVLGLAAFCIAGKAYSMLSQLFNPKLITTAGAVNTTEYFTNSQPCHIGSTDIDLTARVPEATTYDTTRGNWLATYKLPTLSEHGDKSRNILKADLNRLVSSRVGVISISPVDSVTDIESVKGKSGQYALAFHENFILFNRHFIEETCIPGHKYILTYRTRLKDMASNVYSTIVDTESFIYTDRDYVAIQLLDMQPVSSLIPYFMSSVPHGSHEASYIDKEGPHSCYSSDPEVIEVSTTSPIRSSFYENVIKFTYTVSKGKCGLPLILHGKQENVIAGIVCAGFDGVQGCGFAATLTQEDVRKLVQIPDIMPQSLSGYAEKLVSDPPHKKCILRFLDPINRKGAVYGNFTNNIATDKPAVQHSIAYSTVIDLFGNTDFRVPDLKTGLVPGRSWYSPYTYNISKRLLVNHPVDYKLLALARDGFINDVSSLDFCKYIMPLSLDDALNGLPGLDGINVMTLNTAAGYPLTGKKSDYVTFDESTSRYSFKQSFLDHLDEVFSYLSQGKRYDFVFKAALKVEEPVTLKKHLAGKYRVFLVCPMALAVLTRKYFLSHCRLFMLFKEDTESAVGISERSEDWTRMANYMKKHPNYFDGDFSSFDSMTSKSVLSYAFSVLIWMAIQSGNYSDLDIKCMKVVAIEIIYFYCSVRGTLVSFSRSNASGHSLTTLINGLVNSILMRAVYFLEFGIVNDFKENVNLLTLGDDQIASVSDSRKAYNVLSVQKHMSKLGMVYTPAQKDLEDPPPFIPFEDLIFLQRKFVKVPGKLYYRAPLRRISVIRALCFEPTKSPLSSHEHLYQVLNNLVMECSQYSSEEAELYIYRAQQIYDQYLANTPLKPLITLEQVRAMWPYLNESDV